MSNDLKTAALKYHSEPIPGKIHVISSKTCETQQDLSLAYTPGVAQPCLEIKDAPEKVWDYTVKGNLVAVVSDGTAVLGLGNIGPEAGLPVMEGKAVLFKRFADIDAVPLCISKVFKENGKTDPAKLIAVTECLEPSFGGINLEDISAPRCFEIERRLKEICDIPVFHDDQHGTAIVVGAALLNALKIVKKDIDKVKVVINGAGAAGISIGKHLLNLGVKNLTMVDRFGAIYKGKPENNVAQEEMAEITNLSCEKGNLADVMKDADVFVGVSAPGIVSAEMVSTMAKDAIVFPMANPTPEIMPDEAKRGGARIVGTGRSDYPNQINNVLAFPGIFRGALDCRASQINEEMKVATSHALASLIPEDELCEENIIPSALNKNVAPIVAKAVIEAARATKVARK